MQEELICGTTVSTLTHLLKNVEGMVVSRSQVQSAVNRLVKAGKLRLDPDRWPKLYVPLSEGRTTYHGKSGRAARQALLSDAPLVAIVEEARSR